MRELIIGAIVVLAGYVCFQFYRAARLAAAGRKKPAKGAAAAIEPLLDITADDEELEATDDVVYQRPAVAQVPAATSAADTPDEPDEPDAPNVSDAPQVFQLELELKQLRRELAQQRAEMAALRERLDATEAALHVQKENVEASLARQGVSPEYNEALLYAQRGLDVEVIAERCGITVAEAELVRSLARRQAGLDEGEGA